ncbi:MAG: cysteine--tRNA ligase [Rhodospirillales bacterium]|nr:cysteine--tRNA ligase [Rhodospirillales bacterium]MCY4005163.1 cysteine--tRNA ligase [Rhodospirillales bacterium]
MPLTVYNTLTRRREPFVPRDPEHIRIYVCGPTVYDDAHIGNARPVVVFDLLVRFLRTLYPRVTYVRNITDVDDKINDRAAEEQITIRELTERTLARFREDMAALNARPPDVEPRATEHISQMIGMIEELLGHGHAYVASGHVLFHVPSLAQYGRLAGRDREEQLAGARVEVESYKRDPADFVLWKPSDAGLPGWESPWGRGRPGWHIECSAMSREYLGSEFDIHGGGIDLAFPHHENEIAQSCSAEPGTEFARYWMHNGYLLSEGEKMAKSLGNFYTVRDLLSRHPGEALRLLLLSTHYRQPIDFTEEGLRRARRQLDRWRRTVGGDPPAGTPPPAVLEALGDDLNSPRAIAALHGLGGAELHAGLRMLGLLEVPHDEWFQGASETGPSDRAIDEQIAARAAARARRDFAAADSIRTQLAEAGVILEDTPAGTIWRRK